MATGTIMPWPFLTGFDNNGDPLNGGLLYTYAAGTTDPLATYSDVTLLTANANPIVLNSAGRPASGGTEVSVFLQPTAYKFVLKTSAGVTLATRDNIAAVPNTTVDLDVTAIAGEALSAGEAAYLSDGSGARVAGRWYKADADLPYASSNAIMVGIAPSAIASGETGTVRLSGRVTGLSGLAAGSSYYVSATAGALTTTAPGNARFLGVADSTTSLVLAPEQRGVGPNSFCQGRLTLTTGTPVTSSDVTGATTLYFAPFAGNQVSLFDGTRWITYTFTERSITLAALTASTPYDVFMYDNAGTLTLELTAWTNATTRATALTTQNGVLVKTGATTRRYLGTVYINGSGGQTDDTVLKRYLYNYASRVVRDLRAVDTADSWAYSTNTIRQANGNAANQVEIMQGVAEEAIALQLIAHVRDSAQENLFAGIGEDSTTAKATNMIGGQVASGTTNLVYQINASLTKIPAVGWHRYTWLESDLSGGGTATWLGDNAGTGLQSGLTGTWRC